MKTLILGLFIITVCVISLIPFSREEGLEIKLENMTTGGNVAVTSVAPTTTPSITVKAKMPLKIKTNSDFIHSIIYAISKQPDQHNDKIAILTIQGLISSLNTENSATLLGEISNPNNLSDPRLFLQYMNWFGSHCPIDSNECTGIC